MILNNFQAPIAGLLLIDKDQTHSSFSYIPKLRRTFNIKKIGHAGTLDPLATGLMIYLIGKEYTKKASSLLGFDKQYHVGMELGKTSNTYDTEGDVISTNVAIPEEDTIRSVVNSFNGTTYQKPPAFSALKHKGKPLYKYAREGIIVEKPKREVTLSITDIQISNTTITFTVDCSSGTYIRSLVHDIGQVCECGAVMISLRRTRIREYYLDHAYKIDTILNDTYPEKYLINI
ncbi:tRNA pseudouridine(55) synthase TruB [Chlamydiia bacterium]|nr:tRNA pseudouridine(55) synthase TruB [Chlamydiia bacterium]